MHFKANHCLSFVFICHHFSSRRTGHQLVSNTVPAGLLKHTVRVLNKNSRCFFPAPRSIKWFLSCNDKLQIRWVCEVFGSDSVYITLTVAGLKQRYWTTFLITSFLLCEIDSSFFLLLLHSVMIASKFRCVTLLGHLILSMVTDTDDWKL